MEVWLGTLEGVVEERVEPGPNGVDCLLTMHELFVGGVELETEPESGESSDKTPDSIETDGESGPLLCNVLFEGYHRIE